VVAGLLVVLVVGAVVGWSSSVLVQAVVMTRVQAMARVRVRRTVVTFRTAEQIELS
jgi:hypothetical protein